MPVTKVLARGWKVEIDGDPLASLPTGTPVYTEIKGLNTLTFGGDKNEAETTSFDSDGWEEHLPASRSRTLSFEGYYYEDEATGDRDPGQGMVEDYNELNGPQGLGNFRLTSPGGKVKTFNGSVNVGDVGGGNDDPTSWGAEIKVSGKVNKEPAA